MAREEVIQKSLKYLDSSIFHFTHTLAADDARLVTPILFAGSAQSQ